MGKYASGVSMKTVIGLEVGEVQDILNKGNLSDEDKKNVIDILKNMAFQWCQSNAYGCAMEEAYNEFLDEHGYPVQNISSEIMHKMFMSGIKEQKMEDTYPF